MASIESVERNRIIYVRPNTINIENGARTTWSPEDLNLSVDLRVEIPNRTSHSYNDITVESTINNGNISFFSGQNLSGEEHGDEYLTDEYTNVSYQEIRNNKMGAKENIGVDSISINFDAHMYPVVKMKFTDVRGYSLFTPESLAKNDLPACKRFFNALFHFPYPVFYLSVKGYYGTKVTFILSVNEFKSGLNADTGHFEVNVSFIGNMYGVYTDIPMNYILAAPYIGAEKGSFNSYWEEQKNSGNFTYDGTDKPIWTYVELVQKYNQIMDSISSSLETEGNSDADSLKELGEIRNKLSRLREIKESFNLIVNGIFNGNTTEIRTNRSENGDFSILYANTFNTNKDKKYIKIPVNSVKFSELYESYNKDFSNENNFIELTDVFTDTLKKAEFSAEWFYAAKDDNGCAKFPLYENSDGFDGDGETFKVQGYVFKTGSVIEPINKEIKELEEREKTVLETSGKEVEATLEKELGFKFNLENVFRMLFAHIDTFFHAFFQLKSDIQNNSSRTYKGFKLNAEDMDNEVSTTTNKVDTQIPPFPAIYSLDEHGERKREYPGNLGNLKSMEEVLFIDAINKGIKNYDAAFKRVNNGGATEDEAASKEPDINFIPLSIADYFCNGENPYKCIKEFLGDSAKVAWYGLTMFMNRLKCAKSINSVFDENIKNEAKNFYDGCAYALTENDLFKNSIDTLLGYCQNNDLKSICDDLNENHYIRTDSSASEETSYINYSHYDTYGLISLGGPVFATYKTGNMLIGNKLSDYQKYIIEENADNFFEKGIKISKEIKLANEDNVNRFYLWDNENSTWDFSSYRNKKYNEYLLNNDIIKGFPFICRKYKKKGYSSISNRIEDGDENIYEWFEGNMSQKKYTEAAAILLSSLVGKNYSLLESKESCIYLPKAVALFYGSQIYFNEGDQAISHLCPFPQIGVSRGFIIDEKGDLFTEKDKNNHVEATEKLNKKTVDEYIKNDLSGSTIGKIGLGEYFKQWAERNDTHELLDEIMKMGSDSYYQDKDNIPEKVGKYIFKGSVIKPNSKLDNALKELYLQNVYVFDIKTPYAPAININDIKDFLEELKRLTDKKSESINQENDISEDKSYAAPVVEEELYYSLKNFYDRWMPSLRPDSFKLKSPYETENTRRKRYEQNEKTESTEYENFVFVDAFYNDISKDFLIDPGVIIDVIDGQLRGGANKSVMEFITYVVQKSKLLFLALPVYNNIKTVDDFEDIFTPHMVYDNTGIIGKGNTYVIMYTYEPSHILKQIEDENDLSHKSDGADIYDILNGDGPKFDTYEDHIKYVGNVFEVAYGEQYQSYFKNIIVNMDNPRVTDTSIKNTFLLGEQGRHGDAAIPTTMGEDLYSVYSERSYNCTVEMLGCVNIMPTMYFQLNGIDLFCGLYQIMQVEHNISNGEMITRFTGVKVSKYSLTCAQSSFNFRNLVESIYGGRTEREYEIVYGININADGLRYSKSNKHDPTPRRLFDSNGNDITKTYSYLQTLEVDEYNEVIVPPTNTLKGISFNVANAIDRMSQPVKGKNVTITPTKNYDSKHICATAVKAFVHAGFKHNELNKDNQYLAKESESIGDGFYCLEKLVTKYGFAPVIRGRQRKYTEKDGVKRGDIALMECTDGYGHICMWNGSQWMSDFNQNNTWVYHEDPTHDIIILRYSGTIYDEKENNIVR